MLSKHLTSRLERIDWDFAGAQSDSRFSALHWHPARLPSQVAATFIGLLSDPGDTILDPFLGSGTTLIEAQRLGRRSIGFDLNPISCLISKAKTLPNSARRIEEVTVVLKGLARDSLGNSLLHTRSTIRHPESVQKKWYTARVMADLSQLWASIQSLRGPSQILGQMAFSAILLPVCKETRHWGYVCDNSTPRTEHEGDVVTEYCRTLDRLTAAYYERDEDRKNMATGPISRATIKCADSCTALCAVPTSSIKLIVTSPPYYGVSDYVKSQRLSMEWFGMEIEPVRLREIGARSKRHRHSSFEEYLIEMSQVFARARATLQDDGACVIVLGESAKRAAYIDSFHRSLRKSGYDLAHIATRNISAQRRQYGSIETETITVALPR